MKKPFYFLSIMLSVILMNCSDTNKEGTANSEFRFITLDPGHFHAALVQKTRVAGVESVVHVYAPEGADVQDHLARIRGFNTRPELPTDWVEEVYTGPDYMEKMITDKPGNIVIISGNNARKTEYIKSAVQAGLHVLADKPMAINAENFDALKQAFDIAKANNVLLYDIMTERYEIATMLQKELSMVPEVFGELLPGTAEEPAVTKESVHHFYKQVSGAALKRPAWFFDVTQQGEGIVDVTTHLVDLIQWECFPEQIIDYENEIEIVEANRWATDLTPSMFEQVTKMAEYPDYLKKDIVNDSILHVYSNGSIDYKIKGIHARVSVIWNYEAPEGGQDTHYSIMRGSKASLVIRQGKDENYQPSLFVQNTGDASDTDFDAVLRQTVEALQAKYPGIGMEQLGDEIKITIPDSYKVGHEAHFTQVAEKYLNYLREGSLPSWEVPNMLAKYYTTTQAFKMSR
ncbi:MAG: putative oxidoreductase C-terminal domain-containing protein [Cyclobacteriaceae bacterium]|nr:putative oxidoreductase C-terminal domain-containing protein [Cyclobacteriaceae bacterium]